MPQVLNIVGNYFGNDSGESGAETPQALDRLQQMLAAQVPSAPGEALEAEPSVQAPVQATDPADLKMKWLVPVDAPSGASTDAAVTHPGPEEGSVEPKQEAASEVAESVEGPVPDESDGAPVGEDERIAVNTAPPVCLASDASEFQTAVEQARRDAETQLSAAVAQIRQATADQHAAELAEAIAVANNRREETEAEAARAREESERRHADELRQVRESLESEVTAAVERVREEEAERSAAEVAHAREALQQQHANELQRARLTVIESFQALTAGILQNG